jgi:hypothetical protein
MTRPIITIHNAETNEVIEREMTKAEHDRHLEIEAEKKAFADALVAEAATKQAVLAKLGITAEEAASLLS